MRSETEIKKEIKRLVLEANNLPTEPRTRTEFVGYLERRLKEAQVSALLWVLKAK